MEILLLLIPISIGIAGLFVGLFYWAARTRQFSDLVTPAYRILHDEENNNATATTGNGNSTV